MNDTLHYFRIAKEGERIVSKTFQLTKGYRTKAVSGVREGFSVSKLQDDKYMIVVNVTAPRLNHVFYSLCSLIEEQAYFTLEFEDKENFPGTKDIYFWTGMHQDEFWRIYVKYSDLLLESSMVSLAYAAQYAMDEVYLGAYKNIRIFTEEPEKYQNLLEVFDFQKQDYLTTVEELQEQETTKEISVSTQEIPEIMEMLDELVSANLRFATRRRIRK